MRRLWALFILVLAGPAWAQEILPDYRPAMVVSEANFRSDPSTKNTPLGTYPPGTQLLILGSTQEAGGREWYLARLYDSGQEGFFAARLVRPLPAFPTPPENLGVTLVEDKAEKAALVGLHALIQREIGSNPGGELVVFEDLGLLYLQGLQTNAQGDRLEMNGWVTRVNAKSFTFQGSMSFTVAALGGYQCGRNGTYSFDLAGDGKAWRLTGKGLACDGQDLVIDIRKRGG